MGHFSMCNINCYVRLALSFPLEKHQELAPRGLLLLGETCKLQNYMICSVRKEGHPLLL